MTSSYAKVNKLSGAHFLALFRKFPNFLMFLNIRIDLLILKTYYGQFTSTTKKSLHIIFKAYYVHRSTSKSRQQREFSSQTPYFPDQRSPGNRANIPAFFLMLRFLKFFYKMLQKY